MPESQQAANLGVYRTPEVVAYYAGLNYLTPCEQLLFDTYLHRGMAILDLGVGGGRTTPFLSQLASHYVGVDYSEEMIRVCRSKFPQLQFEVDDAADLSRFADASFDAVVVAFNGIGNLAPDEKREQCLRECYRVLKPSGVLIFSSHNPRALFIAWQWDRERLRLLAGKVTGKVAGRGRGFLFYPALAALTCARVGLGVLRSVASAMPRVYRRVPTKTFWRGEGYLLDPTHGGILNHYAVPGRVVAELTRLGFTRLRIFPENYPRTSHEYSTRWYYYAFSKSGRGSEL